MNGTQLQHCPLVLSVTLLCRAKNRNEITIMTPGEKALGGVVLPQVPLRFCVMIMELPI